MWLMTPHGFLSVVAKGGPGVMMVRARDAESLSHFLCVLGEDNVDRLVEGEGTDYPFRVASNATEVTYYLSSMVEQIDYSNFKDRAKKTRGQTFANFLSDVWTAGWKMTPTDVMIRQNARMRLLNPHYMTNGDSEWGGVMTGHPYTGFCDCCGKKLRKCKCTEDELDDYYAGEYAVTVKDVADMTDAEFAAYEALTS